MRRDVVKWNVQAESSGSATQEQIVERVKQDRD